MNETIAFWLVPTHDTRRWFEEKIRDLSERFQAPLFEPHLTVHAGPAEKVAAPSSVLAEAAFDFDAIVLRPGRIGHSEKFTKTLYLEFHNSQQLVFLAEKLRERVPSDYVLQPHISLLYHKLPEAEREALANSFDGLLHDVRFEVMQAVFCPRPAESAEDVHSWQIVEEWRL